MFCATAQPSEPTALTYRGVERRRFLAYLVAACVALTFVVIILGAFTRLVDAGLGCPDWPGCYGHLTWPTSAEHVSTAEARFPEFPVEHDKTWPEMVHRYFAGMLGLFILSIAIISWRWRDTARLPQKLPRLLLGLVILQAAFGMWTVTLKLWPQIVTAHLLGGFATLSLLWLLLQRLAPWRWPFQQALCSPGNKRLALIALIAVVIQIALGGWTSANYAALACADLPTCHGQWWPQADFAQGFNVFQHVGPNYLGGLLDNHARTAIHLSHRMGAIIVTLLVGLLAWRLWRAGPRHAKNMTVVLAAVLTLQIALGLSNILWALPLPVAVAHNAGGAMLLLVLVTLNHRLRTAQKLQGEK